MISYKNTMHNNMALVGKHLAKQMKPICAFCTRISAGTVTTANGVEPACKYCLIDLTT